MRSKLLVGLLVLSLAANAWFLARPRPIGAPPAGAPTSSATPTAGAKPHAATAGANTADADAANSDRATTAGGALWRKAANAAEWRQLAADLRAAGFPDDLVRFLIYRSAAQHARERGDLEKLPFWHQGYESKFGRALREKIGREANEAVVAALGDTPRLESDPVRRAARYGNLPDAKIAQLDKIEQDYGEVYWQQRRAAESGDAVDTFEGRQRLRLLEEEKERDLAAVLTPEELSDYQRRGSRGSRLVISGVQDIEVSEEEFDALYAAQKSHLDSIPRTSGEAELAAALHGSAAPAEQVRAILGEGERFHAYMAKVDPVYAQAASFAKTQPTLPLDRVYALYQLQSAALLAVAQTGAGKPADLAATPAGRAAIARYQAQLDTLLGPELAASYRRSPAGRLFAPRG
jgi:CTP:molybdopterin cytidylyltransferase MocA